MLIASALLRFSNKIDINIKEGTFIFIYKLFDKRLLSLLNCKKALYRIQYPLKFFFFSKGEFLKIARLTLCIRDFIPKVKGLLERMYFFKKDNISSSREFPILLYLMAGLPNFFSEDKV